MGEQFETTVGQQVQFVEAECTFDTGTLDGFALGFSAEKQVREASFWRSDYGYIRSSGERANAYDQHILKEKLSTTKRIILSDTTKIKQREKPEDLVHRVLRRLSILASISVFYKDERLMLWACSSARPLEMQVFLRLLLQSLISLLIYLNSIFAIPGTKTNYVFSMFKVGIVKFLIKVSGQSLHSILSRISGEKVDLSLKYLGQFEKLAREYCNGNQVRTQSQGSCRSHSRPVGAGGLGVVAG